MFVTVSEGVITSVKSSISKDVWGSTIEHGIFKGNVTLRKVRDVADGSILLPIASVTIPATN